MLADSNQTQNYSLTTRLLLAGGAIGPLLFILVFLFEDATRPNYSPWHNFVSALSLSDQGWMQIANFLICGVLVFGFGGWGLGRVFRTGTGRFWGPVLLALFGFSLIIAGLFVTDPTLGYPPGASTTVQTLHGTIHGINAPIAFGSLTVAIFVLARRFLADPTWRRWGVYSLVTGVICIVSFIASLTVAQLDKNGVMPNAPAGLFERIAIICGWVWVALLALRLLRQQRVSASSGRSAEQTDAASG